MRFTLAPDKIAPALFFTSTRRESDVCGDRKSWAVRDVFGASATGWVGQEDEILYPVPEETVIV